MPVAPNSPPRAFAPPHMRTENFLFADKRYATFRNTCIEVLAKVLNHPSTHTHTNPLEIPLRLWFHHQRITSMELKGKSLKTVNKTGKCKQFRRLHYFTYFVIEIVVMPKTVAISFGSPFFQKYWSTYFEYCVLLSHWFHVGRTMKPRTKIFRQRLPTNVLHF